MEKFSVEYFDMLIQQPTAVYLLVLLKLARL